MVYFVRVHTRELRIKHDINTLGFIYIQDGYEKKKNIVCHS